MSTAPAGTAQVAAARNFAAESPDAAADLSPCGVPGKAAGFPSWSGAENASQGRDEAILGVLLRAAALRGGRRRRSRFRAAAGCRLPASPHPALRSSPKTEIPVLAPLSKLSPLLPGACREAGARWARGLGGAEGGSSAPFLAREGGSVPGHGARKTPAFPLGFSCEEKKLLLRAGQ